MVEAREEDGLAGYSLKTFLITSLGVLLFGIYIGVLMYGENSLTVLDELKEKKENLILEMKTLKVENQILQKEFFVLKQLDAKE